jgi:hypothetical protein
MCVLDIFWVPKSCQITAPDLLSSPPDPSPIVCVASPSRRRSSEIISKFDDFQLRIWRKLQMATPLFFRGIRHRNVCRYDLCAHIAMTPAQIRGHCAKFKGVNFGAQLRLQWTRH